jgi:hypothetical protein
VGSGVKFGLLTSKREMLTTTTLFRRIKHAYDKQEELVFHREAFLTPPLFTQLCRKFRSRELPVAMLDVLLIREFGVEEINAQSVAKAFIDGARMVGVLNENNIVADIDQLAAQQPPRRELASPPPSGNVFRQSPAQAIPADDEEEETDTADATDTSEATETARSLLQTPETNLEKPNTPSGRMTLPASRPAPPATTDAIAHLFGFNTSKAPSDVQPTPPPLANPPRPLAPRTVNTPALPETTLADASEGILFRIQLVGPGLNTELEVVDIEDLALVRALLDKIERRLTK